MTRERLEMGVARSVCVRSRMVRSPKYSAAALWLCPVAAPSSPSRILRASNHSSKAAARASHSHLQAGFRVCYKKIPHSVQPYNCDSILLL